MNINLVSLSAEFPIEVSPKEYQNLVQRKTKGWSQPDTELEWLAKLHYLRQGLKEGKLDKDQFQKKEEELILNWWRRFC